MNFPWRAVCGQWTSRGSSPKPASRRLRISAPRPFRRVARIAALGFPRVGRDGRHGRGRRVDEPLVSERVDASLAEEADRVAAVDEERLDGPPAALREDEVHAALGGAGRDRGGRRGAAPPRRRSSRGGRAAGGGPRFVSAQREARPARPRRSPPGRPARRRRSPRSGARRRPRRRARRERATRGCRGRCCPCSSRPTATTSVRRMKPSPRFVTRTRMPGCEELLQARARATTGSEGNGRLVEDPLDRVALAPPAAAAVPRARLRGEDAVRERPATATRLTSSGVA